MECVWKTGYKHQLVDEKVNPGKPMSALDSLGITLEQSNNE